MALIDSEVSFSQRLRELSQKAAHERLVQAAHFRGLPRDSMPRILFNARGELESSATVFWKGLRTSLAAAHEGEWEEAVCLHDLVRNEQSVWHAGQVHVLNPTTDYMSTLIDRFYPQLADQRYARCLGKPSKRAIGFMIGDSYYTYATQGAFDEAAQRAESRFDRLKLEESRNYYQRQLEHTLDQLDTVEANVQRITGDKQPLVRIMEAMALDHGVVVPLSQFQ